MGVQTMRRSLVNIWRRLSSTSSRLEESSPGIVPGSPGYLYVGSSKVPYCVEPDLDFRPVLADLTSLQALLNSRGYDITRSFGDLQLLARKYDEWYRVSTEFVQTYPKERLDELKSKKDSKEHEMFASAARKLERLDLEVIRTCLRLPADLHPWTPVGDHARRLSSFVRGRRIAAHDDTLTLPTVSHLEILRSTAIQKRPLVEFKPDPPQCFLLGETAHLLRTVEEYFSSALFTVGYRRVSPAHFVRSSMMEAYYGNSDDLEISHHLPIQSIYGDKGDDHTWALNLAGHGPLPYLALFTRKALSVTNATPLKFFSIGTAYGGKINFDQSSRTCEWTLFNFPIQRPVVTLWTIYGKEDDSDICTTVAEMVEDLLCKMQLSFMAEQQPSFKLLMPEMSRVDSLALMSNASTSPVRLASVSGYGDFLSRRIRLQFRDTNVHKAGKKDELDNKYAKCCYAEIDLFNVLARIYEEMHPKSSQTFVQTEGDEGGAWWPTCLRPK